MFNASETSVSDEPPTLTEIICNVRDAVVTITAKFPDKLQHSTGFIIKDHYIVCPASTVLAINHKAIKIFATISNVEGKSYVYEVTLIGLDGVGNIAILIIDSNLSWNKSNPKLDKHPYLLWGKSRNVSPGTTVIIIDNSSEKENAVIVTNISDNRYVSYTGNINGELLLLANNSLNESGLPVLTTAGKIIGMIVKNNLALSEFFMRRPIKALIKTHTNKYVSHNYNGFIELIDNCYHYIKGCLGLSLTLVTADDYILLDEVPTNVEIIGYKITAIHNNSITLAINDIITHMNKCPLGDRKGQINPALVMWLVAPNTNVTIRYRKFAENYNMSYETIITAISYEVDFPFYDGNCII